MQNNNFNHKNLNFNKKDINFNKKEINQNIIEQFEKLKLWIEDSLDLFKNDLIPLVYPIFLKVYLDEITNGNVDLAKKFFNKYRNEFNKKSDLIQFETISLQQHILQNNIVNGFVTNKYFLCMSKYAYSLLINFIEENNMIYILKIMNSEMEIKIQTNSSEDNFGAISGNYQYRNNNLNNNTRDGNTIENINTSNVDGGSNSSNSSNNTGGSNSSNNTSNNTLSSSSLGVNILCDNKPLDLETSIISLETQSSILTQEKYRYDHLENYVQQIKRTRKTENKVKPSPSLIESEIEKLKDIIKRVAVNSEYLPSICCYTVQNTYSNLTTAEISNDLKFLACGYSDSYIDIHTLTKVPLKKLKSSSELSLLEDTTAEKSDLNRRNEKTSLDKSSLYKSSLDKSSSLNKSSLNKSSLNKSSLDKSSSMNEKFDEIGEVKRLIGHIGPIFSLKFSNTSKLLISSSADCTIRLWSLELFECIAVYKTHSLPVWTLDFSSNDFFFASGGADRQAILWCTKNIKPERIFLSALSDVTVVKFHPNFNYLFIGSSDYKIRMHDIDSSQLMRVFDGHNGLVKCIDIRHDGKLMVSGGTDKKIILWDLERAKIINVYIGHTSFVYSVSFCYFGSIISSSGADNSVRLWDIKEGSTNPLQSYFTKNTPVIQTKFGHINIVACVGPYTG